MNVMSSDCGRGPEDSEWTLRVFAYFGDRIVYPGLRPPAQLPAVNGER
jgi:hypothetical protein